VCEMYSDVISKPICRILSDLTQESRLEVAPPLAIKDWVRLKLRETREQRDAFEQRYGMDFQLSNRPGGRDVLPTSTPMR